MRQDSSFSYEEAIKELENILAELESGNGTLEQDIERYERGMQLCGMCKQQLNDAQLKIERVAKDNHQTKGE